MNRRTNKTEPVGVDLVSAFFADCLADRSPLRLVVFSACDTSTIRKTLHRESADVAEALVANGVPAVVANQLPVPDDTAAAFVGPLYGRLLESGDVDDAVAAGRMELFLQRRNASKTANLEWGIPTLHRHPSVRELFEVS